MILIKNEKTIAYDDVCLVPAYSDLNSRSEADITTKYYSNPIITSPMIHTSSANMITYFLNNNMCATVHRYFDNANDQIYHVVEAVGDDFKDVFFAVGKCQAWIKTLHNAKVSKYCVDMAHGDSKVCVDTIKYIRKLNPTALIMAGNVATYDGYKRLIDAGADYIRVGVAGGSICSTAKNTAFGVPMITSIIECAKAKDEVGGILIADGGIRSAADILKAIAAGADMAMCGKLLAATSEAEGPFYDDDDLDIVKHTHPSVETDRISTVDFWAKRVEYAGMASHEMRMRNNSHTADSNTSIEGVCGVINYTGTTDDVINAINANLKSGMSYCGSRNWKEFKEKAVMRLMSVSGIVEKDTHLDGRIR